MLPRNRALVLQHLLTHPCVDCGERDITVLDFDHVRGEKLAAVSCLMDSPLLGAEIEKCEVRCGNCHRTKTARERNWWIHRRLEQLMREGLWRKG